MAPLEASRLFFIRDNTISTLYNLEIHAGSVLPPDVRKMDRKMLDFLCYLCTKYCDMDNSTSIDELNFDNLNFNTTFLNLENRSQQETTSLAPGDTSTEESIRQKDAILYIIVVLMFYSFGVVVMIVGYLKKERKDLEEERFLEDFLREPRPTPIENKAGLGAKLALQAINTAGLITQPNTSTGKVTFV